MDKKNLFLGSLFVVAAVACYYVSYRFGPTPQNPVAQNEIAAQQPATPSVPTLSAEPEFAAVETEHAGASTTVLQNDYIEVHFTNFGGAIRDVELKKYPKALHNPAPFDFNELHKDPLFAFVDVPGLDRSTKFALARQTDNEVDYEAHLPSGILVTRRYILPPSSGTATDPYQLRTETTFTNPSGTTYTPPFKSLLVALGTAAPVNSLDRGYQLMSDYYTKTGSWSYIVRSKLEASGGLLGLGLGAHPASPDIVTPGPLLWGGVANQFFVSVFTPDQPFDALVTRRVKLDAGKPDTDASAYGITADAETAFDPIPPHGTESFGANLYVGPKEYRLLANVEVFHENQDRVMNLGYFRWFAALLLTIMTWMHGVVANWGVAIILTTLLLKICFLPFTLAASRSAKRMQKLQPEMKAIKEKYKDNPQKQQMATMQLYKEHKVNPLGGCIPMVITIPFFWGLFAVLRNAAQLRFAHFLWVSDLTQPDTVAHIFGVPINVLPIVLGLAMFLQTHFTPQASSMTVDSSQQKMMKFMPVMFTFFYYNWSSALALYSTVNAVTSMAQQWVVNHTKDEPVAAAKAPAAGNPRSGKPVKNVTPKRR